MALQDVCGLSRGGWDSPLPGAGARPGLSHYAFGVREPQMAVLQGMQPAEVLKSLSESSGSQFEPVHGTTTLAFTFQHGVIVATDSRGTAGNYIGEQYCGLGRRGQDGGGVRGRGGRIKSICRWLLSFLPGILRSRITRVGRD
uniref:Uncharacterized protein n=1 Tax=Pseudonaja textilis TaxID=8673 RepID=A0A670Z5R4_PSETE